MIVATEIAEEIIDKQTTLYADGKEGSKDVMSILGICFLLSFCCFWRKHLSEGKPVARPETEVD